MTIEIFEKHPEADAYRVGGFYSPYCLVSKDKRFSDAELAAEFWSADATCAHAWGEGESTDEPQERFEAIRRFTLLPHFDA